MKRVLVTGSAGEIGQALIKKLCEANLDCLVCLDLNIKPANLTLPAKKDFSWFQGSVTDKKLLLNLVEDYKFDTVFHLAAILSAGAASNPELAKEVNIEAPKYLIQMLSQYCKTSGQACRLIFPSSIAVYHLDAESRNIGAKEDEAKNPYTIYGQQKLEIENIGSAENSSENNFDFRSLRFPGLLSTLTVPVGGTSDYASLMAHNASKNIPYNCFVRPETTLTFLAMPDAVEALFMLAAADKKNLRKAVYNLHGFTVSAQEIADYTKETFPNASINFIEIVEKQKIVDSWPAVVDCSAFVNDLGWKIRLDKKATFFDYLFPGIKSLSK